MSASLDRSEAGHGGAGEPSPASPSVLFVISEDWFFVSHFLPLARVLVAHGYEVGVLCRVNDPSKRAAIADHGIRVIETASFRERTGVRGAIEQVARVIAVLRRERPTIVHLISLRMVVIGGMAALLARVPVRVVALTGLGLLGAAKSLRSRLGLMAVRVLLRRVLAGPRTVYLFENEDDPVRLGIDRRGANVAILGGAGIDPSLEVEQPMPGGPTLRVALVARMIFSKGIAVAVEAVTQARQAGTDVTLTLVGMPDPGNPRSLTAGALRTMASRPGISWVGRSDDVAAVWRDHHVVCVPSLGGEGLPRSLLEGAAAGRPVVTTRTPGCATFVRSGVEGLLVPAGDVAALANAFSALAADRGRVEAMGRAARARVLERFTVQHVAETVMQKYDLALRGGRAIGTRSAPPGSERD